MKDAGLSGKDTDIEFLQESMQSISEDYNLADGFGRMKEEVWKSFLGFLQEQGLLTDRSGKQVSVNAAELFTNELLA